MTLALSVDEFLQLAPDASSAKSAKGLVIPAKWPMLAFDDAAIWGECQGSGSKPYQTQIDLSGPAFRCSCPSRKFPCKHGLALGLLYLQHHDAFGQAAQPGWVSEWLASRAQRAERQERKQAAADKPAAAPDPKAAARRDATRLKRWTEGMTELECWMADRLRQGLAQLPGQHEIWDAMAARMVDAQLPGLAYRLRRIGSDVGIGEHWHRAVLAGLGQLQLLIEAARRIDRLTAPEQADVRAALGMPHDKDSVLASGEQLEDDWLVLGVQIAEEERLLMRRAWLRGSASGRIALLLDYSHGTARFEPPLLPGDTLSMPLAFYPSAAPLRALVVETPRRVAGTSAPSIELEDALATLADQLSAAPWQSPRPLLLSGIPQPSTAGYWALRTAEDTALRLILDDDDGWTLTAVSGGRALCVFGEWDGERLRPLSAWDDGLAWSSTG